jgi:2-oxoglutarate dehydrogenase E2 component (dihydrolipoamide succinyltransferase)
MKIQMPRLGETIVEGTILKWLKAVGETVQSDEPLFEISTDKVDTEVPSPVTGVLTKILVGEGETVPVGTELAEVESEEEAAGPGGAAGAGAPATAADSAGSDSVDAEAPAESGGAADVASAPAPAGPPASAPEHAGPVASAPTPAGPPAPAPTPASPPASAPAPAAPAASAPVPATSSGAVSGSLVDRGERSQILSPLVRRLAEENSVDLSLVVGTGTGGRITKTDVLAAVGGGSAVPAAAAEASTPAPVAVAVVPPAAVAGVGEEIVPMSHIRKAIASHMLGSIQGTARAWTMVEVNVEHLVRLRERAKDAFFERHGVKLTYLPMVTRATTEALLQFPMVNAELRGDDIVVRKFVNMGIAVSYDQGLIVPVIRNADGMNVAGLARAIADLAARARSHKLQPDEVQESTFTITNPGPYGSIASVPIINQPNAGILSLDAIQKRAIVIDDAIAIRSMVNVSMSWDHRVIDGELATRFLARVKENLETWDFAEDLGL